MAMLVVLETLSPDERAVFVLREVFGFGHDEIASAVGKSTAAVRQMAHRAREHVQSRRKRFEPVDPQARPMELTTQFFAAAATGDVDGPDGDAGPRRGVDRRQRRQASARPASPVAGAETVARLVMGLIRLAGEARPHRAGDVQQRPRAACCTSATASRASSPSRSSTAGSPTSTRCATRTSWPASTIRREISR